MLTQDGARHGVRNPGKGPQKQPQPRSGDRTSLKGTGCSPYINQPPPNHLTHKMAVLGGFVGSEIKLALGNLEVDWGKNETFHDHLPLFQKGDLREPTGPELPTSDTAGVHQNGKTLIKRLRDVLPRLRLLGYTLASAADEYETLRDQFEAGGTISFEELVKAAKRVDVSAVPRGYYNDYAFGRFFDEEITPRLKLKKYLPRVAEQRDYGEMMENFHPWSALCLLAQRPENLEQLVVWDFSETVEGGWETEESFVPALPPSNRFLVVTEGSSDAKILRKALDLLRPSICDFFYFVDMQEGYPFSGTGNLANFCKGLISIGILNKTLIVFDNDAEGVLKVKEISELNRPSNLSVMLLPELSELKSVETIGPRGRSHEDINGRAASIEAYLDLKWESDSDPVVRWSNYLEKVGRYQGALVSKAQYARRFLDL